jgi:hypothetical protein
VVVGAAVVVVVVGVVVVSTGVVVTGQQLITGHSTPSFSETA